MIVETREAQECQMRRPLIDLIASVARGDRSVKMADLDTYTSILFYTYTHHKPETVISTHNTSLSNILIIL